MLTEISPRKKTFDSVYDVLEDAMERALMLSLNHVYCRDEIYIISRQEGDYMVTPEPSLPDNDPGSKYIGFFLRGTFHDY